MNFILRFFCVACIIFKASAQLSTDIRLNQIGFYTNGPKIVVVVNSNSTVYHIKSVDRATEFSSGVLSAGTLWAQSNETAKTADFSNFTTPGNYVIEVDGLGYSYPFEIKDKIFVTLSKAVIKAFYFNRSSTALDPIYAGQWARESGHPDNAVIVHAAAASAKRPAGTIISSPKGWYDAGDYNSYIVNSGISTYSLLAAYEHFKGYYDTLNLNIPESNNSIPDILDEIKWNIDWMLTMQDKNDGGVYTKKTNASFDAFIMPVDATSKRYVVQKSTGAAGDFAAVMAVAYRIYQKFDPAFATICLDASKSAYAWALANPTVTFTNPAAQSGFPAVVTGGYGDGNLSDELEWAANELYIATKDEAYYQFDNNLTYGIPTWNSVRTLGLFSLVYNRKQLTPLGFADTTDTKNKLITMAEKFKNYQSNTSPYKIVMGVNANSDFTWGSNSQAANQAMILLNAYLINKNADYAKAVVSQVDYLLGRNATGYSYVTGFGSKRVMNIHHRQSGADGISDPVPGWLAGGPSGSTGDGCPNNPTYLAKSFTDLEACYTKVEVAINWNAPAVYITGAMEFFKTFDVTGLEEDLHTVSNDLTIYPIPAEDKITIDFRSNLPQNSTISITDLTGKEFYRSRINTFSGNNTVEVSLSVFKSGVYLVKIESGLQSINRKMVVNKN